MCKRCTISGGECATTDAVHATGNDYATYLPNSNGYDYSYFNRSEHGQL